MAFETDQTADRPMWKHPTDDEIVAILRNTSRIAIVGASANPMKDSHRVLSYLASPACGYEVYPINPNESEILGLRCYPSIAALPATPEVVNVFRRIEHCPQVAEEAVAGRASVLWLQLGLHSIEAINIAYDAGLDVVSDRCTKIEHSRLNIGRRH